MAILSPSATISLKVNNIREVVTMSNRQAVQENVVTRTRSAYAAIMSVTLTLVALG